MIVVKKRYIFYSKNLEIVLIITTEDINEFINNIRSFKIDPSIFTMSSWLDRSKIKGISLGRFNDGRYEDHYNFESIRDYEELIHIFQYLCTSSVPNRVISRMPVGEVYLYDNHGLIITKDYDNVTNYEAILTLNDYIYETFED